MKTIIIVGVSFHATATPLPSSDKVTVTTDFVDVGSTDVRYY